MSLDPVFERFVKLAAGMQAEDWNVKVNRDWTVKDAVAHLVGWERECALVLPQVWRLQSAAWFLEHLRQIERALGGRP